MQEKASAPLAAVSNFDTVRRKAYAAPQDAISFYWPLKRLIDIMGSIAALLGFAPLYLLIALVIFLDDPHGSPFYVSTRCGKNGKPFRFFKFRTMRVGADKLLSTLQSQNEADGPAFKIRNDPRITRVGRVLRKTGLDEFPQFLNVLLGDMSIVGPRPPLPHEVEQYTAYQRQRLYVIPGITCSWQITPCRNQVSFAEWVEMDLTYIRTRSIGLDFKLIGKTATALFFRHDGE